MAPRHQASLFFGVVLALGAALLLPFLLGQARFALDDSLFDPDMFTLYGFFRIHDPELFTGDLTAAYYQSLPMPPGFRALQVLWAQAFDPRILHRGLPFLLWLSCLWPVYVAGRQLGGRVNAVATLGIFMASSIFIFRMVGGMAHGFGFPLTWWALAALLAGSPAGLAGATVASALFYPAVAPVSGLALALWLLFPALAPQVPRSGVLNLPWWKRLAWLAVPGGMTLALMLPVVLPQQGPYGPAINVLTERDVYPEAGNPLAAIDPFAYTIRAYALQNSTRLGMEAGQVLTLGILGLLLLSILLHDPRDRRPGGVKPYAYAVAAVFLASFLFAYDHAYRFAIYNFPVLVTLFLPPGLRNACRVLLPARVRSTSFAALVLGYIAIIAHPVAATSGYLFDLEPFQRRALDFIGTLPKNALLAGWPGDRYGQVVEAVPYVAQRRVLVTWAGHPVAHRDYVLAMRERMNALLEAYLARDVAALRALRDRFGVEYLVVNARDFEQAPQYIPPFSARAAQLWEENRGRFVAISLEGDAVVYAADGLRILDLRQF